MAHNEDLVLVSLQQHLVHGDCTRAQNVRILLRELLVAERVDGGRRLGAQEVRVHKVEGARIDFVWTARGDARHDGLRRHCSDDFFPLWVVCRVKDPTEHGLARGRISHLHLHNRFTSALSVRLVHLYLLLHLQRRHIKRIGDALLSLGELLAAAVRVGDLATGVFEFERDADLRRGSLPRRLASRAAPGSP